MPAPGLIAASVMSKKLAAGADAILLDVKVAGPFMPDLASARELAVRMRDIGVRAGRPTVCELTAMDSPLGAAVGNALEVAEACEMLAGRGPGDFRELCSARPRAWPCSPTSASSWTRAAPGGGGDRLGEALRALERLVEAQGGNRASPSGPRDAGDGAGLACRACAARRLGGALRRPRHRPRRHAPGRRRERKEDVIDHAVGIVVLAKPGDAVEAGQPLAHVFARTAEAAEATAAEVLAAYAFAEYPVERPPLLLETVG